jgi:inorganic triphosphatase YgiF
MAVGQWVRTISLATSLAAAAALPSLAGTTAWDQSRATQLADQLEDAAKRFEDQLRKQPPATASSGQPDSAERLRDQAQRLENSATSLAAHLGDGEGRKDTEPLFKSVTEIASETAESARNQLIPKQVMADWDAVTKALESLASFYGSDEQDAAEMPAEALDPQKE